MNPQLAPGELAMHETAALLPPADRRVLRFHGDRWDRVLNGLVTADLAPLSDGGAVYAFILTAKGRPLADLRVIPRAPASGAVPEAWLDIPAGAADEVTAYLTRSVPPIFARFEPLDAQRVGVVGPDADGALSAAASSVATESPGALAAALGDLASTGAPGPLSTRAAGPLICVGREPIEGAGVDLYVPSSMAGELLDALEYGVRAVGGAPATAEDYERFRVERGLPVWGREISADRLPQETGQTDRAISFSKGCYTGQEVVARLHYRGHVNRLLRGLRLLDPTAADGWSDGVELERGGRTVGWVTTRADSARFGPIALGYVRREILPGERVSVAGESGLEAVVVELPFTSM